MAILYHYCSNQAFVSTISERQIRLTLLTLSNDTAEGRHVRKVMEELAGPTEKRAVISEAMLDHERHLEALGYCLSADGDLLSQWRSYADDARGVAIGFDGEALKEHLFASAGGVLPVNFEKVIYDRKKQEELLKPVVSEILTGTTGPLIATLETSRYLFTMKDKFFREERETRIIEAFDTGPEWGRLNEYEFLGQSDRIKPYRNLKINCRKQLIKEVILGPRHLTPAHLVEGFLASKGFDGVEVKRSRGTYR